MKELEKRIEKIESAELAALKENKEVVEKDIDYYLKKDAPYSQLFDCLDDGPMFKGLFDPAYFFELLDSEVAFFTEHAENYTEIKKRLKGLGLEGQQRYFLLHPLKNIIEQKYADGQIKKTTISQLALDFLLKMFQEADLEVFPFRKLLSPNVPIKPTFPSPGYYQGIPQVVEYQKAINQDLVPYYPIPAYLDEKFTMKDVIERLEEKPDYVGKMRYLIEISTEYQHFDIDEYAIDISFIPKCDVEIKKFRTLLELPRDKDIPQIDWKLREGKKTDFIRVLNALYDLKFFDGQKKTPTKKEFMEYAGIAFGVNLSDYHGSLSQAKQTTRIEANLKIFEDMKTATENYILEKKRS